MTSEEIAVFDKLNSLLNEQEKNIVNNKNIKHIVLDGTEVPEDIVKDVINRLGVLVYGED